jgi:hypothetical protein
MCAATRQPTIIREYASTMKHAYANPAHVGTYVRSVTHNAFGRVAVKFRSTRSAGRGAEGSGRVVRTFRRRRLTPSIPARIMRRAT